MEYLSNILAFVAIIVSVVCAHAAYKQSTNQFTVSLKQNEVANQLAVIDKRIDLYLFLKNVKDKLDYLDSRDSFNDHSYIYSKGVRKKKSGIFSVDFVLLHIFGLDLFSDLDIDFDKLSERDPARLHAALARLDRYSYYCEAFWKDKKAKAFLEHFQQFCNDVVTLKDERSDAKKKLNLGEIVFSIEDLKKEIADITFDNLKKFPPEPIEVNNDEEKDDVSGTQGDLTH